jgi:hypothetical protein
MSACLPCRWAPSLPEAASALIVTSRSNVTRILSLIEHGDPHAGE